MYNNKNDINKREIRIRDQTVKWSSEHAAILEDAIVLSEDEQLFALARSVLESLNKPILLTSIYPSAIFVLMYTLGKLLNMRLNLYIRPFMVMLYLMSFQLV